jgi:hypothetical protein
MTVLIFALAILASNRKEIEASELAFRKQIWKPTNSEPMPQETGIRGSKPRRAAQLPAARFRNLSYFGPGADQERAPRPKVALKRVDRHSVELLNDASRAGRSI